jgi:Ca2+-binding RTX toxin-like protein
MVSGIGLGLSARSDHAVGSFRDDFIMGGDGGDDIAGGGSGDWLFGDDNYGFEGLEDPRGWGGRDTLRGGAGNDNLYGGAGGDTLYGGDGNDDLDGSHGADRLKGGAGNDWLWNVEGDDVADGGEGTDTLGFKAYAQDWGEPGRTVVVDLGAQTVRVDGESQGRSITSFENVVVSRGYAATVQGSAGANSLYGGDSGDSLAGDWGGDVLEGGYGDDILAGGQGNDTLNGDEGLDALFGGTGRDAFVFNGYSYSTPDVVKDFRSGEDVIRVRLNTAPFSAPAPIDPDRFKDLSQGPADADDLVLYDPGTGALYFARDGEPEVMAWLGAGTALAAADVEIAYI